MIEVYTKQLREQIESHEIKTELEKELAKTLLIMCDNYDYAIEEVKTLRKCLKSISNFANQLEES